jgi:hypothetical protein
VSAVEQSQCNTECARQLSPAKHLNAIERDAWLGNCRERSRNCASTSS